MLICKSPLHERTSTRFIKNYPYLISRLKQQVGFLRFFGVWVCVWACKGHNDNEGNRMKLYIVISMTCESLKFNKLTLTREERSQIT